MKNSARAGMAAALIFSGSALAADLPLRQGVYAPPPPPPALWTGFFGGVNIGGGWTANTLNHANLTPYTDPLAGGLWLLPGSSNGGSNAGGVVGGGQIGYDWQFRNSIVVGAEADFQGSTMQSGGNAAWALYPSPVTPGGFLAPLAPSGNIGIALNWFGTVRGRAGFLVSPTFLVYGTAGFAYGQIQGQYSGYSNVRVGWTAGGGVEWLFRPGWSVKGEYLFMDLDSGGTTGYFGYNWGYRRHPQINIFRLGVNYRFNTGVGGEPIMAAY
ncbi:outer membrane protein [Methylocystis parvus]|uniref:Porin family protein n=1 Tax=Methylocystis parvus TaxID=134 RepID=A0A6B8M407_9HYPH|nr:outer membrane beta-barrel protein [Methylocystis parvus]QGM97048.1 porin family protein [Methylocystis parvus]WBJ99055.1 outer membrane beta-barrel protein [Methylocystis parvus OBBP]